MEEEGGGGVGEVEGKGGGASIRGDLWAFALISDLRGLLQKFERVCTQQALKCRTVLFSKV